MSYNRGDALKISFGQGTQVVIYMCKGRRSDSLFVRRWNDSAKVLGKNESHIHQNQVLGMADEGDPRTDKARKAWLDMLAKGV